MPRPRAFASRSTTRASASEGGNRSPTRWAFTSTRWLSEYLPHVAHWAPARAQALTNPDDLGAIIALDAILGNWDRHARNLLLVPQPSAEQLRVYSIDIANAWIGTPADIAARGLESPGVEKLAPGIPVDMIRDGAEKLAEKAAKLDPSLLSC